MHTVDQLSADLAAGRTTSAALVEQALSRIADPAGRDLGHFTLAEPLEAVVLDDRRVLHGVTPVRPLDAARPAWRDVLVLTLRAEDTTSTAAHG